MRAVLAVLALAAVDHRSTPIAAVVELLGEYRSKVQTDGEVELELYNKFACWCEDTMHTKTRTIAEATKQIADLSEDIKKLKASTASSATEMARLSKAIAENGASTTSSNEQRSSQKDDFKQTEEDLETCIANVDRAITVLAPHDSTSDGFRDRASDDDDSDGGDDQILLSKFLSVKDSVQGTLDLYEHTVGPDAVKKTTKARELIKSISEVQTSSPHLGTYAPQSTAIQGILKALKDSLTSDLAEARAAEAEHQQGAEELRQAKRQEKSQLDQSLDMVTSLNANDGVTLASSEMTRQETEAQLATDTELLASTKENCATRATEWSTRSRVRTEELAGINEAIETLNATAAQDTFGRQENETARGDTSDFTFTAPATFLQLSAAMAGPKTRKQLSIITMASKVTSGHFDEVMHYIDQYVGSLNAEGTDDEKHKAWCVFERNNADNKVSGMTHDLEVLEAEHDRADDKNDELKSELNETEIAKDNLGTTLETAQETRVDEQQAARTSMADTVECIRLVESAMASLAKVYTSGGASFLQRPGHRSLHAAHEQKQKQRLLLHKHKHGSKQPGEPEMWASGGGSAARESDQQGIMFVMTGLKKSLETDLKEQEDNEAYATAQFNKFRTEATASDGELEEKIGSLERAIAAKDRDIVDLEKQEAGVGEAWNATSDYLDQLRPNCDWVELTYDTRKTNRANEISGLKNAKVILSGFTAEEGLVSTRSTVKTAAQVPAPVLTVSPAQAGSVADELAELNHDDADAPPPPPL